MRAVSRALLALGALALCAGLAHAQDAPCSGHGQTVDGKCACTAALPADDASVGYVGDTCATPVHHLYLNGQDVSETCAQGHVCNVVAPGDPVCFAANIADLAAGSYHLSLLLVSNSVDAAVTLRGLLTNFTASTDPATNVTTVTPLAYPSSTAAFSFALHTTHDTPSSQLQLTRRQLGYGAYTGLYLCAESTASTTIMLRGAQHSCPHTLLPNGTLELCSGRGSTDTCPHGACTCPPPYAPPANWVQTAGLGFDDCSATLQQLAPGGTAVPVPGHAPGTWAFFAVEVPATGAAHLHVAAAATEATQGGSLAMFLRFQQPPGEGETQHDLASDVAATTGSWARDASVHLDLMRGDAAFRPGTWYVGVYNKGSGPVTHAVSAALYACPNDCGGRGTCAADTGACTCADATALAPDCVASRYELKLGQPLEVAPRPHLVLDKFVVKGVKALLASAATQRLTVSATFNTSGAASLPAWVTGRPVVVVSPKADDAAPGAGGSVVWPEAPVSRMALSERGAQYTMSVGPWMVGEDDALHLALWNPLSGDTPTGAALGYVLLVSTAGSCLGDCSGHGTCDAATGTCACTAPFAGGDCSVDTSSSGKVCAAGAVQPVRREDLRGTCWQACKADGSGFETEGCGELTCDGKTAEHGNLRRKGTEKLCVEDQCQQGANTTVVDAAGRSACQQACTCPDDGSACVLTGSCLAGTLVCLNGLQLSKDGSICESPPACAEGSLKKAYDLGGSAGSAFAVCTCATAADPASCAYTSPSEAGGNTGGVVSCLAGFERQGPMTPTRLSDGSSVVTGGFCVAAQHGGGRRRGVSGGMVFFYCLLSIVLAAGLVVGGKYGLIWWEQYKYGRSVFSQGYVSWPLFGNRNNAGGGADDW
ncbi:hypothetical protein HXX76_007048 [Chlamydomonas incerta]|uniref:EGF-like domain-containing protein n=1 Tax=Chlamydomonas incerta TaxID=51695 RepID=A0A835W3F6_CHLIN|nr:hypothetical protein HXX76_007048 [Chlamydomonas incerta]|eukprot:KAG2435853.1 hypothetical protein HXX76_007048 [Chlamydomonas incerta]